MLSNNINHYDKAFQISEEKENRKGGRFSTSSVFSNMGEVLDLSSCGALIIKRRFKKVPQEAVFIVEIKYEEIRAVLNARLARQFKKRGIGQLLAVEFVDVTEEQRDVIRDIVRNSRSWRLFDFTDSETDAA
ncbi:MAG: hypothetical protein AAF711_08240 [Planctomycetota bacterium]